MARPMAASFDADTALRPAGEGAWEGEIVDGWQTPRGPLGGYVMAIVMRGMEIAVGDPERQARSVTMHFLRVPEHGPVAVSAQVERAGRSLSTVSGRLEQDGKLLGLALGAWSKRWEGPLLTRIAMPQVKPPEGRSALDSGPDRGTEPPAFTGRLSMQHRLGSAPFTSADRGEVGGWIGLVEERPIDAPGTRRPRGRLVPGPLATAEEARPGADDRPHRPLPLTAPDPGRPPPRPLPHAPRARRLLRGGRRAVGAGWHPRGAIAPARPPPGRRGLASSARPAGRSRLSPRLRRIRGRRWPRRPRYPAPRQA